MSDVKPIAPVRIGLTDIFYAQGMRAGSWLFFTGHEATDFEHGIAGPVAGKPGQPLGGQPRYLREGRFIFDRFAKLIAAEGGDLRHIVRVDQYYPRAECVNPYQRARKTLLEGLRPAEHVGVDGGIAHRRRQYERIIAGGSAGRGASSRTLLASPAFRSRSIPASSLRSRAATMCSLPGRCRTTRP